MTSTYQQIEQIDLISPYWADITARLPRYLRHIVVIWVGTLWAARLAIFYEARRTSVSAIKRANNTSWLRAWRLFWRTQCESVQSLVDFAHINSLTSEQIRCFALNNDRFQNVEILEASVLAHRPVILLLASFSLHYLGLVTPSAKKIIDLVPVRVVQPSAALSLLNKMDFYQRLSISASREIDGIYADQPAVAVHIGRALKKRQIVAMRIDSLPVKAASYVIADFLGGSATFPLSILEIAAKFDADLIPFFVQKDDKGFITSFGDPVRLGAKPSNVDFTTAATEIYAKITERILEMPGSYLAWHAVFEKWRMSEELKTAMHSITNRIEEECNVKSYQK